MKPLNTDISIDPAKGNLWVNIKMTEDTITRIDYVWNLYSRNVKEPFRLTKSSVEGNNDSPHDDYRQVMNDYDLNEPISNMSSSRRYIKATLDIIGKPGDKYNFSIELKQGATYKDAKNIGSLDSDEQTLPDGQYHESYSCIINFVQK